MEEKETKETPHVSEEQPQTAATPPLPTTEQLLYELIETCEKRITGLEDVDAKLKLETLNQRMDIIEQTINNLNKTTFATSCANVAIMNLLKQKNVFTAEEIDTEFEKVLDSAIGLRAKVAGEEIRLYDNLICEIWIDDMTNPNNKSVDYRGYLNKVLYLTDEEGFEEFKELTSLHGQIFTPGMIYKVIRKMPEDYTPNASLAGKEIVYAVQIHAIKTNIELEKQKYGTAKDISNNTNVQQS